MFKKILLAAAALSTLALGASAANAGYGISIGYGQGYGYGYGHHHHYYNNYSYYQPSCYTQSRPVTIHVWDDYSWEYIFKTVYRDYRVCD